MAPLRRSGTIVTCLFLQSLSRGLTLDVPSNVVLGQTTRISWTSSSADPGRMDLYMRCNGGRFLNKIASSVSTAAESSFVTMPSPPDRDGLNLPLQCTLRAETLDGSLLDEVRLIVKPSALQTMTSPVVIPKENLTTSSTSTSTIGPKETSSNSTSSTSTVTPKENSSTSSASRHTTSAFESTQTSALLGSTTKPTNVSFSTSFDRNPSLVTTSTSHNTAFTSESTQKSMIPLGAIVGGVVGGLVVLGILTILLICIRRRYSPSALAPVPFAYDQNYIQPSEKSNRLSKIINERQVDQWQRGQSQTEVERITHSSPSALSDTSSACEPLGRQVESLQYRILGLEVQQRNFEHQLYGEQPPPSYLD
ncbi:hypothetical protein H2248_010128 [Termitomyces sp. 'cryptogamus']|nr:hypothetical protein H2248_010128 [Termitomyces sp. 'cryptogamus']